MASELQYDDSNLQKLFAELEPKRRVQALKGGFRKLANKVRKKAVDNLRESIHTDENLEKGVRAIVFKRKAGFRVTVGSKKKTKKADKSGENDADKPTKQKSEDKTHVLIWAEDGTVWRKSKKSTRYRVGGNWRRGSIRGRMPRYGFMAKTQSEVRDTVTDDMHRMVAESVERIAKKYGCK